MRCYRRIFKVCWKDKVSNNIICNKVQRPCTVVHTRGHETRYTQIHCYKTLELLDLYQLPLQCFKEKLSTIRVNWLRAVLLSCFILMHGIFFHHPFEHLLCTTSSARDHYYVDVVCRRRLKASLPASKIQYAAWYCSELSWCQHWKKKMKKKKQKVTCVMSREIHDT